MNEELKGKIQKNYRVITFGYNSIFLFIFSYKFY